MKPYTVADSPESLAHNIGTEIMASSFEEARDKAEALGVEGRRARDASFLLLDTFFYTITDGKEVRDMECEYAVETVIEGGDDI